MYFRHNWMFCTQKKAIVLAVSMLGGWLVGYHHAVNVCSVHVHLHWCTCTRMCVRARTHTHTHTHLF
jgi:hypothetical protein